MNCYLWGNSLLSNNIGILLDLSKDRARNWCAIRSLFRWDSHCIDRFMPMKDQCTTSANAVESDHCKTLWESFNLKKINCKPATYVHHLKIRQFCIFTFGFSGVSQSIVSQNAEYADVHDRQPASQPHRASIHKMCIKRNGDVLKELLGCLAAWLQHNCITTRRWML